jgi:hypothetical protein
MGVTGGAGEPSRRLLLSAALAAAAAPRIALAAPRRVPLDQAFILLEPYLELPPAQRDRFYFAYRAVRNKTPAPDAKAAVVGAGGERTPLRIDADGLIANPPSLADLKSKAMFEFEGPPFEFGLEMRAAMAPAARLDAGELKLTLAQAGAAMVKFSGSMAYDAPKINAAYFPGASTGQALSPDGSGRPLPLFAYPGVGKVPYFEPSKWRQAVAVMLDAAPTRILLGSAPR